MPRACVSRVLVAAVMLAAAVPPARAQGVAGDSLLVRVQRLASDGQTAAGRALVDSALGAAKEGSPAWIEAVFACAAIAESADGARRDYLRIALDYSASPRAGDSLLRLAQMEIARGDRAAAKQYLERLELEHPLEATRAQGAYWLGRVLLDEGALVRACASLAEAKASAAPADVEFVNQIAYYSRQCAAVQRAADSARADSVEKIRKAARADSVARAAAIAKAAAAEKKKEKTATKKESPAPAAKDAPLAPPAPVATKEAPAAATEVKGRSWSVQVAAYNTPEEAQGLVKKLGDRGFDVRITNERPFRVRIGRYARRSDAVDMVGKLASAKITAIVVEAEKP
jgi:cell division septation protein DedD